MKFFNSSLFVLFFLISVNIFPSYYVKNSYGEVDSSYNSIGQTGLIHLPSASLQESGTVGLTLSNGTLNEFLSIIATPFPWLEASYYYQRPRGTIYIKKNKYLDKGFNLKIGFNYKGIDLAIGLDDIAGTGISTKEYLVASTQKDNYIITLGFGTGAFAADHQYKNPISSLRRRPALSFFEGNKTGGEVNFNSLFKGPVGIFGGIEFFSSRLPNLVVKIESNPFDYQEFLTGGTRTQKFIANRKKEKDFNYGIYYKFKNNYVLSMSEVNGNLFNLTLSTKFNFNKAQKQVTPKKVQLISNSNNKKLDFYRNILRNLEKDDLFLQSAELNNEANLHLGIANNKYNNPVDVFKHAKIVTSELASLQNIPLSNLTITNINSGIEISSMSGKANNRLNPDKLGYINLGEPGNNTKQLDYQTFLQFPEFYNSFKPKFIYRYADPTRFFAGGIDLQLSSEIKFTPNLFITTTANYQLKNSFNRNRYAADSPYLPHVRTDTVLYLQNRQKLYLESFEINNLNKISNGHYVKLSAGMYEMMFGGYGIEYLWKPFMSNLSVGLNLYAVKQRDFQQRLKFRDYKVTTGHSNFIYFHPVSGLTIDLSIGKYLAGDKGYTLDFSRRFQSGFKIGAYFTRTNISKIVYGEGSFDKGFYFDIPFSIFDKSSKRGSNYFQIQPLTRDGGAKLKTNNPLIYSFISGAKNDYTFFID